jgi:hypothetical protein
MRSWMQIVPDTEVQPSGRRPLCLLIAERPMPAALRGVSGAGAWIETPARPACGAQVELRHPDAGSITGRVLGHDREGVHLVFDRSEAAVAFALAAIASEMVRPAN